MKSCIPTTVSIVLIESPIYSNLALSILDDVLSLRCSFPENVNPPLIVCDDVVLFVLFMCIFTNDGGISLFLRSSNRLAIGVSISSSWFSAIIAISLSLS